MTTPLAGKTALVTGGSRGIGAEIARTLAARGALVAVHYAASREKAEAVAADIRSGGGEASTVSGDLGSHAEIAPMFAQLDSGLQARTGTTGIDILVNNAGRGGGASLTKTSQGDFDAVLNLNVKGLFFVTQEAASRLRDHGRVVNISSLVARGAQAPRVVYAASKWAVNGFTISFAGEFASRWITVNAVSPGAVATDLIAAARKNPEFEKAVIGMTGFGRLGEPKDIADVVAFLCGPEAGWITGQTIEATGGTRL